MATTTTAPKETPGAAADATPRSHVREAIETIVFVVTLVLLLKLFVVEAFVIPTGSMAETLYGYQKIVDCPQCAFEFPVNAHEEVEGNPATRQKQLLVGYCCPNCRYQGDFNNSFRPDNEPGDRVLVLKPLYHFRPPHRGDVVVFKYPEKPEENYTATNYIKRAMGFGGETLAIFRGELFRTRDVSYPADLTDEDGHPVYPRPANPFDAWQKLFMYSNAHHNPNPVALERFDKTRKAGFPTGDEWFQIIRKTDDQVLACKRIVYDNDHQAQAFKGVSPPRWSVEAGWNVDDPAAPKVFTHSGGDLQWMRYKHLIDGVWENPASPAPSVVKNFLGYNAGFVAGFGNRGDQTRVSPADDAWVGDLLLECEVDFQADTELTLELSRSIYRYQAEFAGGNVTLKQAGKDTKTFSTRPSGISGGTHRLRFANVDSRLRVWVDGSAIDFGGEADYSPVDPTVENGGTEGWTVENDLNAPASIGMKGAGRVQHVSLWRDIYYTHKDGAIEPNTPEVYYVQPGHTLCLGDNSAQSSDSRMWGTVPERLMLGKAVFVFWPRTRIGFIK